MSSESARLASKKFVPVSDGLAFDETSNVNPPSCQKRSDTLTQKFKNMRTMKAMHLTLLQRAPAAKELPAVVVAVE